MSVSDGQPVNAATVNPAFVSKLSSVLQTMAAALKINKTTDSSSTSTGSLIVAGGVGIAKKLFVGDAADFASTITVVDSVYTGGDLAFEGTFAGITIHDATNVGADQDIVSTSFGIFLTNSGLTSIWGIYFPTSDPATEGQIIIIGNATTQIVTIKDASNSSTVQGPIYTGFGKNYQFLPGTNLVFQYDGVIGGWKIISDISGSNPITDSLTLADTNALAINTALRRQTFRVQGASGAITLSSTPFSGGPPCDGAMIYLIGNDDANTVTISQNDSADGCLMDGNVTLTKGKTLGLMYSSSLARYVRMSP